MNASETVDLSTMIEAYTINGAYTMGLDDKQGSIEPEKRADFVVLDKNLFATWCNSPSKLPWLNVH